MTISIRPLTPEDWEILRDIRIRAVKMHTGYFLAKPEETQSKPPEYWKETLDGNGKQVFGLFDDNAIIGIAAVFTWRDDEHGETGVMAMDFIEPDYRSKGYSSLLYKQRIEFAKNYKPWKKLIIGHREGNEPSRRAMLAHGFEYSGQEMITWPDGTNDIEHLYELDLEKLRG